MVFMLFVPFGFVDKTLSSASVKNIYEYFKCHGNMVRESGVRTPHAPTAQACMKFMLLSVLTLLSIHNSSFYDYIHACIIHVHMYTYVYADQTFLITCKSFVMS